MSIHNIIYIYIVYTSIYKNKALNIRLFLYMKFLIIIYTKKKQLFYNFLFKIFLNI